MQHVKRHVLHFVTQSVEAMRQAKVRVKHAPNNSRSMLITIALFRQAVFLFLLLRAIWSHNVDSVSQLAAIVLAGVGAGYAFVLLIQYFRNPPRFFSRWVRWAQIAGDIVLLVGLRFLSRDPGSDIFFFVTMPMLIMAETHSLRAVWLLALLIGTIELLIFFVLIAQPSSDPTRPPLGVALLDVFTRTIIPAAIALGIALRNLIADTQAAKLERARQGFMRRAQALVQAGVAPSLGLERADEELATALQTARPDMRVMSAEQIAHLMTALNVNESSEPRKLSHLTSQLLDHIATAYQCSAATLRFARAGSGLQQEPVLELVAAYGCAKHQTDEAFRYVPLSSPSMAAKVFREQHFEFLPETHSAPGQIGLYYHDFATRCSIRTGLAMPVTIGGQKGVIALYRSNSLPFYHADVAMIESMLEMVSVFFNAHREQEARARRMVVLLEIARELQRLEHVDDILNMIARQAAQLVPSAVGAVFLLRNEELRRKAIWGVREDFFPEESYPIGHSFTGRAFQAGRAECENAVSTSRSISVDNVERYKSEIGMVAHLLAAPIQGSDSGRKHGVIRLINKHANLHGMRDDHGFTAFDAELLALLAALTSIALDAATRLARQRLINTLTERLRAATDIKELYSIVCAVACQVLNADASGFMEFIDESTAGKVTARIGYERLPGNRQKQIIALDHTQFGIVDLRYYILIQDFLSKRQANPVVISNVLRDERVAPARKLLTDSGISSIMIAPVMVDEMCIGTLGVDSLQGRREFSGEEVEQLALIAQLAGSFIQQMRRSQRTREQSGLERKFARADLHTLKSALHRSVLQPLNDYLDDYANDLSWDPLSVLRNVRAGTTSTIGLMDLYMSDLMGDDAELLGLRGALARDVARLKPTTNITLNIEGGRPLPNHVERNLYRIAQEAIANARRHGVSGRADAAIRVLLSYGLDSVILSVSDDGPGIPQNIRSSGFGLKLMRDMANALDTSLDIQVGEEGGTQIVVRVPVANPLAEKETNGQTWTQCG